MYAQIDVAQSIKSMLDLILTNDFGRSISLTGRGATNTSSKIAFTKLQVYKIMTSWLTIYFGLFKMNYLLRS